MTKARLLPALGAGLSLIVKRPLTTFVWGLVNLILATAPSFLALRAMGPDVLNYYRQLFSNPAAAAAAGPPAGMQAMQGLEGIQLLGALVSVALVFTAIQRAVLFPEKRSFFSLRVGWAELRTALIVVILYVLFIVAIVVAAIVLSIPMIAVVASSGAALANHVGGLVVGTIVTLLAITAAIGYPIIRLSMAVPMSLAENRFRLFEAWTLTKGYGWPLFAIALLQFIIVFLVEILILAVMMIALVGATGGFDAAHLQAFFGQPDWVQKSTGWLVLVGLVYALVSLVCLPFLVAPWARAYQLITGTKTADAHGVFD